MHALLLALTFMPRVDGDAEFAHDLGLDEDLRATITIGVDLDLVVGEGWRFEAFTAPNTYVRSNTETESFARISPHQIHYPVGGRLRWALDPIWGSPGWEWGLLAFHQSNHDVDVTDEVLNRETVAYEIYGAELEAPWFLLSGGLYYDRGTRLSGRRQKLPFDHYLAGVTFAAWHRFVEHWYGSGELTLVGTLDEDHSPPYLNVSGRLETGAELRGEGGRGRIFLRIQRVEDYQHLSDEPRYMLSLGLGLGTR